MGFGKKTAYTKDDKPRVLDLDATYELIIEPAVTEAGLRCVRADKMLRAGMIDTPMYEMLMRADLVIADISTGNVNAVYELGIRHALRPYTTILMQEDEASFHFDLSHVTTFTYHHLGEDIGGREAMVKKQALKTLIERVIDPPTRDSPVYEFLRALNPPFMSEADYANLLTVIEERGDPLSQAIRDGKDAMRRSAFNAAARSFDLARGILTGPTRAGGESIGQSELAFVTQQLALAIYKSKEPTEKAALENGLQIISTLNPDSSNDTETLGIAGAIRKRLWKLEPSARAHLDKAIVHYGQGFNLRKDYYNGDNFALCLDLRAGVQEREEDALYDRLTAKKVRQELVERLTPAFAAPDYEDRPDKVWMNATMASSLFALNRPEEAAAYEDRFFALADAQWMRDTYGPRKAPPR
jgi:hypothetical protein